MECLKQRGSNSWLRDTISETRLLQDCGSSALKTSNSASPQRADQSLLLAWLPHSSQIVDGKGHLLGRLASVIAKEILSGEKITVVRCEEINVSGSFFRNKVRTAAIFPRIRHCSIKERTQMELLGGWWTWAHRVSRWRRENESPGSAARDNTLPLGDHLNKRIQQGSTIIKNEGVHKDGVRIYHDGLTTTQSAGLRYDE